MIKGAKMKTKTNTKTILAILLIVLTLITWGIHTDKQHEDFARANGCEWVVVGSHEVCR